MTSRKSNADSFNSLTAVRRPSISTAAQLYNTLQSIANGKVTFHHLLPDWEGAKSKA
jgi:hypothetical protein